MSRALPTGRVRTIAWGSAVLAVHVLLLHNLTVGLGTFSIADWDEGRHIANAIEMLRANDWLVNRYQGEVDYFNLKPPASMWTLMVSMQLFGVSPLSVRLPSVLATLLTSGICAVYSWRRWGALAAVVSASVFASSVNIIDTHSGRTADPDAIFVLMVTISVLSAITALRRPWLLLVSVTGFSMAFLTKSYHAMLLLVFVAALLLLFRRSSAVRIRHLAVALVGLLPIVLWAVLRYSFDGTTFLLAMVKRDVLDRSRTTIEGHVGGPDYYLNAVQATFGSWLLVLLIVLVVILNGRSFRMLRLGAGSDSGRILVALAGWVALVFVAFSMVSSKLAWYTLPAFPALALLAGGLVAIALRSSARPMSLVLVLGVAAASWSGQAALQAARLAQPEQPAQVVLSRLSSLALVPGAHLYLDPVVAGGWPQSFTAVAEMYSPVRLQWTGPDQFLADESKDATLLVQQGSETALLLSGGQTHVVAQYDGWSLVQRGPAA